MDPDTDRDSTSNASINGSEEYSNNWRKLQVERRQQQQPSSQQHYIGVYGNRTANVPTQLNTPAMTKRIKQKVLPIAKPSTKRVKRRVLPHANPTTKRAKRTVAARPPENQKLETEEPAVVPTVSGGAQESSSSPNSQWRRRRIQRRNSPRCNSFKRVSQMILQSGVSPPQRVGGHY